MPLITLHSSEKIENQEELMSSLSDVIAKVTGKPSQYIMVTFSVGPVMLAGKLQKGAFLEVRGIGGINRENNAAISKEISLVLEKQLGLSSAFIYINFMDINGENWGLNGTVFG